MNLIGLDLDGTLEDSRADMTAVVHRVRAGLSLPARPDEAVRPWINKGMDPLYRACFDDYIQQDDARLAEVRERYEADYLENIAVETRLYPGIAAALEPLSALGRLAVITNKPERISLRLLEVLGLDKFVTAVIGGDTCSKSKPDPMVLKEAARRSGFNQASGQAVMIGDTETDMKLGRAFGATTIWAAWGYAERIDAKPDFVAHTPAELPTIVRSIKTR
ncbi:MAG: HAD-IA family hydrolase [Nitrospirota bacterium]